MDQQSFPASLPHAEPFEIADGIYWVRLGLPFQLDHVNIYLLRDSQGWVAIDTGVDNPETRAAWGRILTFISGAAQLRRVIVTHHHVDHVGAAGWLARETGCRIVMSVGERQAALRSLSENQPDRLARSMIHLRWLGCDENEIRELSATLFRATDFMGALPEQMDLIAPGEEVRIGNRLWHILPGKGHSTAPVMLHCAKEHLLLAGDQILSSISPFVGTFGDAPLASPLRDYLAFLEDAEKIIPEATLVLGGHGRPFRNARSRIVELMAHHHERCDKIVGECRAEPMTVRGLIDRIFTRSLDGVMTMALAEVLSHVNLLVDSHALAALETPGARLLSVPSRSRISEAPAG